MKIEGWVQSTLNSVERVEDCAATDYRGIFRNYKSSFDKSKGWHDTPAILLTGDDAERDAEIERRISAEVETAVAPWRVKVIELQEAYKETSKLKDALRVLRRTTFCEDYHHTDSERHESHEPCPVEDRLDALASEDVK